MSGAGSGWTPATDLSHITRADKVKPARLSHPDAVVTTTQAERDAWAVKTLLRKQVAGEVLTELQLALVERVAPGSAATAAAVVAASPAPSPRVSAPVPAAAGSKRGRVDAPAGKGGGAREAVVAAAAVVNPVEAAKISARAARFEKTTTSTTEAPAVVDVDAAKVSARAARFDVATAAAALPLPTDAAIFSARAARFGKAADLT